MFLDPNKTDDDALFSRNGWPTKHVKPYDQNLRKTFLFILSAIFVKVDRYNLWTITKKCIYGTRFSRMDQVKFFKGCLAQILLGPFLNTMSHIQLKIT